MKKNLINALKNDGFVDQNVAYTANGAVSKASTKDKVLDFFANGGTFRNKNESVILNSFQSAFAEDELLALKALFYFRDCRGGQGERKLFNVALRWLAMNRPDVVLLNLENIPFYGRWDGLLELIGTPCENQVLEYIATQLKSDILGHEKGESISLLAKWLPSLNTSSAETRKLGAIVSNYLGYTPKQYRQTLSALRSYLNVVEQKMCAKKWAEIDYNIVPSNASTRYRNAFKKQDALRYTKWQEDVKKGRNGAKVNASVSYPYELVSKVRSTHGDTTTLDLQWKALPNYLPEGQSFLCIVDTSGSMASKVSGDVSALDVAISLGMYCAEKAFGPYKNHFITFSASPMLQEIKGKDLKSKVDNLCRAAWDMNTDLEAAFMLILKTAVKHNLSQKDLPSTLLVISDMEFDASMKNSRNTNYESAKREFARHGYNLPKVVFWRVNSLTNQSPVVKDTIGTILVSGFSPSVLKYIFGDSWKVVTPYEKMLEVLNSPRYERVITDKPSGSFSKVVHKKDKQRTNQEFSISQMIRDEVAAQLGKSATPKRDVLGRFCK